MAISLMATIQRWVGISKDAKPVTDIKEGSTFHESDTGKRFIWLNSTWIEDISGPISDDTFNTAQAALRRLAELQSVASSSSIELDAGHHNFIENR